MPAWRLWLAIAAVTILWGGNWPAMKIALTEVPPWTFRMVTVLGAGLVLLLLARLSGQRRAFPWSRLKPFLFTAFVGVTLWHMFTAYGVMAMGGGRAAIIAFTMPIWTALLSIVFLGERPNLRTGLSLLMGMAGLAVLLAPDFGRIQQAPLGTTMMLAAAMVWGSNNIVIKAYDWPISTMALAGWQLLVGGLPIVVLWLVLEPSADLSHLTWRGVTATLYVCLISLVFCFTTFLVVLRHLPAVAASLSMLAIPVVGLASSAVMLGEPVGVSEVLALMLVLGAMALVTMRPKQNASRTSPRAAVDAMKPARE